MKDSYKGISLLLLGALASLWVLSKDDHGWQLAQLKWPPEPSVDELQQQILAGVDPSEVFEATAAGGDKPLPPDCYVGQVSRNMADEALHGAAYQAIKHEGDTYISVNQGQRYYLRTALESQTASRIQQLPEVVAQRFAEFDDCKPLDIFLARLKED